MANAFKSLLPAGFEPATLGFKGLPYTNELWWQLAIKWKKLIIKQIFLITYLSVSFVSANHMQASVAQWIKELSSGPKEASSILASSDW